MFLIEELKIQLGSPFHALHKLTWTSRHLDPWTLKKTCSARNHVRPQHLTPLTFWILWKKMRYPTANNTWSTWLILHKHLPSNSHIEQLCMSLWHFFFKQNIDWTKTHTSWWFFTNPSEKYVRQIGSFPQGSGVNIKKYVKPTTT